MTKQEFMVMSLPYSLYCSVSNGKVNYDCVRQNNVDYALEFHDNLIVSYPILYPLSDLTKEIDHNGEKFVPIERLKDVFMLEWCDLFDDSIDAILEFAKYKNFKKIEYLPFCIVQKLVEWKFNLMDESEEFINVNDLDMNPYK